MAPTRLAPEPETDGPPRTLQYSPLDIVDAEGENFEVRARIINGVQTKVYVYASLAALHKEGGGALTEVLKTPIETLPVKMRLAVGMAAYVAAAKKVATWK